MKLRIRLLAVLLTAVLLLPALPALPASAYSKATYDDIKNTTTEELRQQIAELDSLLQQTREDLKNAEKLQLDAEEKRQTYLTLEALYNDTIGAMEDELLLIEKKTEETGTEIARLEIRYQEKYCEFLDFLRMIYQEGTPNYLELIVGAKSFSELLSRIDRLRSLMGYSDTLMRTLTEQKAELEQKYAEQQKLAEEQEAGIAGYEQKQRELAEWQQQNEAEIAAIENEITRLYTESANYVDKTDVLDAEFQEMVKQLQEEENARRAEEEERRRQEAIRAEEARKAAEEAARLKAIEEASRNSGFMWPVPMSENIVSSKFGNRMHPVYNKLQYHYGIDIACPRATPIYASKGGVVITSTYHASYGYYIMIDHLDGTSTLYAHCLAGSLKYKKGDKVNRGDQIASVGSTGVSTGYHVHFEVRVNNNNVDPLQYVVNKPSNLVVRG